MPRIGTEISDFFNNEYLSDFQIKVLDDGEETTFYCHRLVLSKVPYFDTLFHSTFKEKTKGEITFRDISKANMKLFLKYIYDVEGDFSIGCSEAMDLIEQTEIFSYDEFKEMVEAVFFKCKPFEVSCETEQTEDDVIRAMELCERMNLEVPRAVKEQHYSPRVLRRMSKATLLHFSSDVFSRTVIRNSLVWIAAHVDTLTQKEVDEVCALIPSWSESIAIYDLDTILSYGEVPLLKDYLLKFTRKMMRHIRSVNSYYEWMDSYEYVKEVLTDEEHKTEKIERSGEN